MKSLLFDWNLYYLFTFLLKSTFSLPFYFSTFSLLFYWNLYFLSTFVLKSLLSLYFLLKFVVYLYFSIEIFTFSLLFYWSLYFLFTSLLKPLLSLYFSIGTSTHICPCTTSAPALHCEKQSCLASPNVTIRTSCVPAPHLRQHYIAKSNHALLPPMQLRTQKFQRKATPTVPRTQRLTPLAFATPCTQIYCENTGIHTLPYFQTCTLSHACHTKCNLLTWAT